MGVRSPESEAVSAAIRRPPGSRAVVLSDRVVAAEIVVLAVPREAIPSVVARLGDVSGRVVVDATNPLKADPWADDQEA